MVVAEGFGSFAEAIRRKLVSEIAGITPAGGTIVVRSPVQRARPRIVPAAVTAPLVAPDLPAAGFLRAASRQPPPCDIGEQSLEQRRRFFNEN
jgi:hypothetical protein